MPVTRALIIDINDQMKASKSHKNHITHSLTLVLLGVRTQGPESKPLDDRDIACLFHTNEDHKNYIFEYSVFIQNKIELLAKQNSCLAFNIL